MTSPGLLTALVVAMLGLVGCADMRDQPTPQAQARVAPLPPEGVVPVGGREAPVRAEDAPRLVNLVAATPESVLRGREVYGRTCAMCHGADGRGTGPVGTKFLPPPTDLTTGKVQGQPDGLLFVTVTNGQGSMPPLKGALTPAERWLAVRYVRTLGAR